MLQVIFTLVGLLGIYLGYVIAFKQSSRGHRKLVAKVMGYLFIGIGIYIPSFYFLVDVNNTVLHVFGLFLPILLLVGLTILSLYLIELFMDF